MKNENFQTLKRDVCRKTSSEKLIKMGTITIKKATARARNCQVCLYFNFKIRQSMVDLLLFYIRA